jgi:predicted nucleic acid-binding protein
VNGLIFVDTSVWVDALRGRTPTKHMLDDLLEDGRVGLALPVRLEILAGASRHHFVRLRDDLSAIPTFVPGPATWNLVENWVEQAVQAGETFAVADLLIAAIASENRGGIWSLDSDFQRLERLGLIRLMDPAVGRG